MIVFGETPYYRITPTSLLWFERAITAFAKNSRTTPAAAATEALAALDRLRSWASSPIAIQAEPGFAAPALAALREAIAAGRAPPLELPEAPPRIDG